MSVLSRVRRTIATHGLARADTRVAVALSGGPDSVALANVVVDLARAGELLFAGLAHFNHELRDTAARDETFCCDMAARLGVRIEVGRGNVRQLASDRHCSIEDAAHHARYAFLEAARERLGADVVALGHTRDDQAETFLLRLVRGAGARGLAAMYPRRGAMIRPLLDCRRAELVEWLRERSEPYMNDETNLDASVPRNRVRAELLPLLCSRFNPEIVDVLADAAELARGEWLWMVDAADAALADVATFGSGIVELDAEQLGRTSVGLQRAVLWRALSRLTTRPLAFRHVEAAAALLRVTDGAADLPGQTVKRVGRRLVLTVREGASRPSGDTKANLFEYSLSIPGEVLVPEAGGIVTAEEALPDGTPEATSRAALVRRDLCGARLTVRNRRPGDRIRPAGRRGSRKLQDVFVDKKIGRAERDRIPVVADENGRILWVAGVGIAEEFRVTDPAQPMLILRFKGLGGSA